MTLDTKKNHDRVKIKITEESVIFISILKWFILSTVIGVIVGIATAFFLKILEWTTLQAHALPYFFLFLPIAFFLSALMIKYLAPGAEGHGTEKVIEAVHKQSGKIKPMVVPIKLVATVITLAFGGSVGKEGPYQVSSAIGITYYYHPMHLIPVFKELFFIKVALAGIFFGIVSFFLVESLNFGKKFADRLRIWPPLKGIIGGLLLVGLALAFSDHYLGLGLSSIQDSLQGIKMVWYAFFLKILFTSITLNFGGSGGIVTPIFFIGVTSGSFFAQIWGLDAATFSAIGMVALLSGAANTPIAASIMAVELFGPQIASYAAVACVISFLMTGHRSVYPSQILSVTKSPSFEIEIGDDIDSTHVHFKPRKKSLIGACLLALESLKRRKNRKKR